MSRKPLNTSRKLPRQDRAKGTVEAILTATAHILTEARYDTASISRINGQASVLVRYISMQTKKRS